jgi:hypothetical protein
VIALRRSYFDDCSRSCFAGYKVSHMKIDCKEQKAPKMTISNPLVQLITLQIIRKSQWSEKGLPRIVAMTKKRPAWSRDTLQDAKGDTDIWH